MSIKQCVSFFFSTSLWGTKEKSSSHKLYSLYDDWWWVEDCWWLDLIIYGWCPPYHTASHFYTHTHTHTHTLSLSPIHYNVTNTPNKTNQNKKTQRWKKHANKKTTPPPPSKQTNKMKRKKKNYIMFLNNLFSFIQNNSRSQRYSTQQAVNP